MYLFVCCVLLEEFSYPVTFQAKSNLDLMSKGKKSGKKAVAEQLLSFICCLYDFAWLGRVL